MTTKEMSLAIVCENCGKIAILKPYQKSNQVYLNQAEGFTISSVNFEKSGDIEEITDIDEVEVEVESIVITCENCGNYLTIEEVR